MGNSQSSNNVVDQPTNVTVNEFLKAVQNHYEELVAGPENQTLLSKSAFLQLFHPFEDFAENLLKFVKIEATEFISKEAFVYLAQFLDSLIDDDKICNTLITLIITDSSNITHNDFIQLIKLCCLLEWNLTTDRLDSVDEATLCSQISSIIIPTAFSRNQFIELYDLQRWCNVHCKRIFRSFLSVIKAIIAGEHCVNSFDNGSILLYLQSPTSYFNYVTLWLLSNSLSEFFLSLGDISSIAQNIWTSRLLHWQILYDSDENGLSINGFLNHVLHYAGPTVCFICFDEYCFCLACDEEWKESSERWGSSNMSLFQINPHFKFIMGGNSMIYFNILNKSLPRGLQIGKSTATLILDVDAALDKVKYYGIDYSLSRIMIFGCADKEVKNKQKLQQQWEAQQANKQKNMKIKINKEDWADSPDRQLLNLGGVKTEHAEK